MSYELVWEPHGVVLNFSGQLVPNDPLNATADYEGDSRFDELLYVIADYTQITGCDARPDDIENVWAIDWAAKHSNPKIRKAVVTTSTAVIKMADHYRNNLGAAYPVEIFATRADARAWLNA